MLLCYLTSTGRNEKEIFSIIVQHLPLQASHSELLPKFPAVAAWVSAACLSRRFLCDGVKVSLEYEFEVALFSMLLTSSVATEWTSPGVAAFVLLLLGVPARRGPGRPRWRTRRDKPRTWFKNHVSMIFLRPPKTVADSFREVEWMSESLPGTPWEERFGV